MNTARKTIATWVSRKGAERQIGERAPAEQLREADEYRGPCGSPVAGSGSRRAEEGAKLRKEPAGDRLRHRLAATSTRASQNRATRTVERTNDNWNAGGRGNLAHGANECPGGSRAWPEDRRDDERGLGAPERPLHTDRDGTGNLGGFTHAMQVPGAEGIRDGTEGVERDLARAARMKNDRENPGGFSRRTIRGHMRG